MNRALPWLLAILSGLSLALAMPGPGLGPLALLFPFLLLEALERGRGEVAAVAVGLAGRHRVLDRLDQLGGAGDAPLRRAAAIGGGRLPARHGRLSRPFVGDRGRDCLAGLRLAGGSGCSRWRGRRQRFFNVSRPMDSPGPDPPPRLSTGRWLMDSLSVWGATGLGWCVVALSSAVWGLFQFGTRRSASAALIFTVGALSLTIVTAPAPSPTGELLRVAAIQPGTSLEEKWDPLNRRKSLTGCGP